MKRLLLIASLLFLSACSGRKSPASMPDVATQVKREFAVSLRPAFVNYPRPDLRVDFDVFRDAGCPIDKYMLRFCTPESPLAILGCDELQEAPALLGGLTPAYPLAVCIVRTDDARADERATPTRLKRSEYFFNQNASYTVRLPAYVRYVIFRDNQFEVVMNGQEFGAVFAPVESADEALSFALAQQGLLAYYQLRWKSDHIYFVNLIEDTHVISQPDGYEVTLYEYPEGNCGPHVTSVVKIKVALDGQVSQVSKTSAYKDPAEDGLCRD